jgi:hypothetical protein
MRDDPKHDVIARRAYEIWEAEGCPEGRHEEHWAKALSEDRAPGADDLSYGEMEQPGPGHPRDDSGLPEASEQAGEGNPDPNGGDADEGVLRRVPEPEDTESDALLEDGSGAGRPGRGIYAGP